MKNLSKISLFLFIVCAFGADGDEVKRVKEGDSVTLNIDFRGRFNLIMWKFGFGYQVSVIAETDGNEISYYSEKFRDRLKLNHQTGSLTVNNMRDLDSGHYEVRIEHNSRISYKKFIVTVYVFGANVERVSVMEGDSLTLDIDYREEFDVLKWMFEHSGSIIAETDRNEASYPDDERFRGRLKLNDQTGSLTINNMRITDTGLYHLEIDQNYGLLLKTFSVTVHGVFDEDGVKTVSVMEGDSLTLDTRLREKFSHIKWRFGGSGSIIAEIDSNEISYPFNDTESFRDRLKLNNQTGSLTIKNMRITDTGLYHLEIDHDTWEPYKELKIVVCRFYPDPVHTLGSVTAIVVVVLLVLSGVIYCCKICKRGRQNRESVTDAEKQKTTDSGDYKLQINPCSEGFTGKNANELETSEIPLLSKEDPDRVKPTT